MAIYDMGGNKIVESSNSPLSGKRIAFIGDSNTQYSAEEWKSAWDTTYGCNMVMLGKAGATWEEVNGGEDSLGANGIGRINTIVQNVDENKLITEYDMIIIMLGTNCNELGELTSTDTKTMCGAVNYCLKKLCYYGRKIPIGIIIPFRPDGNYYNNSEMPTKFQYLEKICEWYSVPVLNLWKYGRIIGSGMTPDGSNYYLGDAVHLGANGNIHFIDLVGKWMAYQL